MFMEQDGFYAKWHKNSPLYVITHWVIFVAFVFIVGINMVSATTLIHGADNVDFSLTSSVNQQSSNNIHELTRQMLNLNLQFHKASASKQVDLLAQLTSLARFRYNLLLSSIEQNPAIVLKNAIPANLRATMPDSVRVLVEEEIILEGTLEVLHIDGTGPDQPFTDASSRFMYTLNTTTGEKISLHFTDKEPGLMTGTKIKARGVKVSNTLALSSSGTTVTALASTNTFGVQKTILILVNFADNTAQPYTAATAQNVMNTVSNFNKENSYDQTTLTGVIDTSKPADIAGWFTIAELSTVCNSSNIATQARQAATAAGYNLANYSRHIFAFPKNVCNWWGIGTIGGNPSSSWVNGSFALRVVGHELGHNLGIWHSRSLAVAGATSILSEYGDRFDIMGATTGHFNAFQKLLLGWLSYNISPPITPVTTSGAYTVAPYETNNTNPKALAVLKDALTKTYYYVEYRTKTGFDSFLAANVVILHTGIPTTKNSSNLWDLDQLTTTSDWILNLGQTYIDTVAGIHFALVSMDATGAVVQVDFGTPSCVNTYPTITVTPSTQSAIAGSALSYSFTLTNNDTYCNASIFTVTPTLPAGFITIPTSFTATLASKASVTEAFLVTSADTTTAGNYSIVQTAVNTTNTSLSNSASVVYSVVPPLDTIAPTVSITSPLDGDTVSGKSVTIQVVASDNVAVTKVEIYIDNVLKTTDTTSPYTSKWILNKTVTAGSHTIMTKAYDASNNIAQTSITVIK